MNIVVGITGGIAAYKAVGVVRALVRAGHDVHVVATEKALRFVGRPTLEAISRNLVHSDLYEGVAEVRHVAIGQAADLIVVAPATANTIAKIAAGHADDLLGNTILASTAPLVVAPAMHTEMWRNPATVSNIATLRARGIHVVGPASGQLTGADSGPGRMSEPDDIVAAALSLVGPRDLAGLRVLVTAGGTREPLDPVRFIGNRSSGRQGVAIARAAATRGADVVLVVANIEDGVLDADPVGLDVRHVSTTAELRDAALAEAQTADVVVMAAAVADYRPETVAEGKIKKETQGDVFDLRLVRNPDILRELTAARRPGQTIIGFAAETELDPVKLLELGRAKAARKGVDLLVLNRVGWAEGFGTPSNDIVVLTGGGDRVTEASGSKSDVADRILDLIPPPRPTPSE
ncbi:bifunctional phosphopantothenoylcysteine decarboxylase/phosphopantothenate--cysteine ligase CoaBC [Pseudolysinimonas sp.]|uniref:bifunctional phosphopantothenoylcysteine decarboxylase/phosphopantothenate--cysteine ligase CoaBC n=1 Tax=Pseudolysinimonas sp. TaxID=2680009 RepID=UPI0037839E34